MPSKHGFRPDIGCVDLKAVVEKMLSASPSGQVLSIPVACPIRLQIPDVERLVRVGPDFGPPESRLAHH